MKLGIITFHRVLNYGAVLQTYALQQTLIRLGYECVVIDYRKEEFEREYRNLEFDSIRPKEIYHTIKCWMVRKKNKAFLNFIENQMYLTLPCVTSVDLEKATKDLDLVITGSDQVFNYKTTQMDNNYYLSFSKCKKASYAASFGFNDFDCKYDEWVKNNLNDFDNISVRETEAKIYLEKLLNRDIHINCDPSFLLEKKDWEKLKKINVRRKYVLVYSVNRNEFLLKVAEKIARDKGIEILYIKYSYEFCGNTRVITDASPTDFITLISDADYVVTNLFHGVAFSMILEKNFYVCMQEGVNTNSRLNYLLEHYELNNRIVSSIRKINYEEIEYKNILEKIKNERISAINYLISLKNERQ